MKKWLFSTLILLFLTTGCVGPNHKINISKDGLAIKGYDTVAYFTLNKPVKGNRDFSHSWEEATWLFSSKGHLDLFIGDPEKYMPQYGGY